MDNNYLLNSPPFFNVEFAGNKTLSNHFIITIGQLRASYLWRLTVASRRLVITMKRLILEVVVLVNSLSTDREKCDLTEFEREMTVGR